MRPIKKDLICFNETSQTKNLHVSEVKHTEEEGQCKGISREKRGTCLFSHVLGHTIYLDRFIGVLAF